jgi:hypothetical protein
MDTGIEANAAIVKKWLVCPEIWGSQVDTGNGEFIRESIPDPIQASFDSFLSRRKVAAQ